MQFPPLFLLLYTAPLLKKEWDSSIAALFLDVLNPTCFHFSRTRPTLTAHDNPINSSEVYIAQIFEQWFDRKKADSAINFSEVRNSRYTVSAVFDADAPPDIFQLSGEPQMVR